MVWTMGYALFVIFTLSVKPSAMPPRADAIVALTGGTNRIGESFDLLLAGKASHLLISGVHKGVSLADIIAASAMDEAKTKALAGHCCITLDTVAQTTRSNAREAAQWIRENRFRSILLVTSDYHILRAGLEFRRLLPDITIIPHTVRPQNMKAFSNDFLVLTYHEYNKYLVIAALYAYGAGADMVGRLLPDALEGGA